MEKLVVEKASMHEAPVLSEFLAKLVVARHRRARLPVGFSAIPSRAQATRGAARQQSRDASGEAKVSLGQLGLRLRRTILASAVYCGSGG